MNRILLIVLTKFSFFSLLIVVSAALGYAATNDYRIINGVMFEQSGVKKIDLNGNILAIHETPSGVFCLINDRRILYVGLIRNGENKLSLELNLPDLDPNSKVKRFFADSEFAYILTGEQLVRLSLNNGEVTNRWGILDAVLSADRLILLEERQGETILNCNSIIVPCYGKYHVISSVIEDRLAVLKDKDDKRAEVIDIQQGRNVYGFFVGINYAVPDKYNLLLDAIDDDVNAASQTEGRIVFYKIFVNGVEAGRTETGIALSRKSFNVKLQPGEYYLITPERWELDRKKEEYVRVNNISQPKPVRVYIPENRIINISFSYDGKEYRFNSSIVTE